jgi:hypothetical protein
VKRWISPAKMETHTEFFRRFSWIGFGVGPSKHELLVTNYSEVPSRERGDVHPNAGVLLLTQEQDDDGFSIRKCGSFNGKDEFKAAE